MSSKSKKIANPEYKELQASLVVAKRQSGIRSIRLKNAMKTVSDIEKEVNAMQLKIDKKRESLIEAVEHASTCLGESQETTQEINELIDRLKLTPKMISAED